MELARPEKVTGGVFLSISVGVRIPHGITGQDPWSPHLYFYWLHLLAFV